MIWKCLIGLFAVYYGVLGLPPQPLLGNKECTWGPSYWCRNITSAKSCGAVKHCIQSVWEHQELPEDTDDICTLCKKMVQEARDQLESNETMDEIKQVFDGTCKLMYLKPAVKICTKLADDFVPELVDTLSSQMNPQVVCSVAGLCNNAAIDHMIEDYNRKKGEESQKAAEKMAACNTCQHLGTTVKSKVDAATEDDVKNYLLGRCRGMGSYSDGCSVIVLEYLPTIMDRLKNHFTVKGFCHLTAACSGTFTAVEIVPESNVGVVHLNTDAVSVSVKHGGDAGVQDETCDLCKQLVKHLKEILIADTTEAEFKQMLQGVCRQTGKFSQQCLSIVEEYYDKIYEFIAQDLNGNQLCGLVDICPGPGVTTFVNGPVWPLLPSMNLPQRPAVPAAHVIQQQQQVHKVEITFGDPISSPAKAQLPLERLFVPQPMDTRVNGKQECEFCQYFLHYIQKVITQPYGEEGLKKIVDKVCDELPSSLNTQCRNFVSLYGDAFVAILAQEIDPSQLCPTLRLCPAQLGADHYEPTPLEGKPGCPLCLMAVEELVEKLKDNKTEESIREALDSLCTKLPKNLQGECDQLVKEYTQELVEMLAADFTPQEVCDYLKLCDPKMSEVEWVAGPQDDPNETRVDILTNEIPDNEDRRLQQSAGQGPEMEVESSTPQCVLCEFIMEKLENRFDNKATEGEIEKALAGVCRLLPGTVRMDCNNFMEKYSPMIVHLLLQAMDPSEMCKAMQLCLKGEVQDRKAQMWLTNVRRSIEECAVCEALVGAVDALLEDKTVSRDISTYVGKVCNSLPAPRHTKCEETLRAYGPSIINLIVELGARPAVVCSKMSLCDREQQAKVDVVPMEQAGSDKAPEILVGGESCTWGPSFWCASEDNANKCGTLAHCREMVWLADSPSF